MKRRSLLPATEPLDDRFTLDNGLTRALIDQNQPTALTLAPTICSN
jgi:hypothetical protein